MSVAHASTRFSRKERYSIIHTTGNHVTLRTYLHGQVMWLQSCSIGKPLLAAGALDTPYLLYLPCSGVTRSMVTPGPETEAIGESGSRGLGAQSGAVPPDAEKGLILHVLRIS